MFSLFTNDLPCYLSRHASVIAYADDTQIVHSAEPTPAGLADLRHRVETDLATLSAWFSSNGLKVNPSKTEVIVFGTQASVKKTRNFHIRFENVDLKPATSIKILGVVLDQELNMQAQTSRVVQRCYGNLITIQKLKDTLP